MKQIINLLKSLLGLNKKSTEVLAPETSVMTDNPAKPKRKYYKKKKTKKTPTAQ